MRFDLTEEQKLLQESASRFLERDYGFEKRRARVKAGDAFDRCIWKTFGEMGWLSIIVPERDGGLGQSVIEAALVAEELGRHQVLEPYVACGILPVKLLTGLAHSRHADLVAGLLAGEVVAALAHSEPQARGNVCDVAANARLGSSGWRINGRKSLVVGAPIADCFIVSARTSGDRTSEQGVSLFLVPADAPGLRVEGNRLMDWSSGADVVFDDVLVGSDALLGNVGMAAPVLQDVIDEAIVLLCAEVVGAMEGAIDVTAEYIKTRKQFGVAIGSFQALQHRMADMAIELVQARSAVYRALQAIQLDSPRKSIDISGCKAFVTRIGKWTTSQGIQLHGGYGMTEEYKVGQYFKRLLVIDAIFGRMDYHLNRYARAIMYQDLADQARQLPMGA